ncbi:MAG: hypothetical protein AAF652_12600, partial [Cyanobacteria bacterium P01_C01_bin.72]
MLLLVAISYQLSAFQTYCMTQRFLRIILLLCNAIYLTYLVYLNCPNCPNCSNCSNCPNCC